MRRKMNNCARAFTAAMLAVTISVGVFACTAAEKPADKPPATLQPAAPKPAEFQVGPATFAPRTVMANDSVTVTSEVTNTGGMAGTYTAVLALDGKEVDRRDISVRPGQSQKVSFQLPTTAAGDHKIAIGQSTAAVTFWDWKTHVIKYDTTEMGVKPVLWFAKGEFGHIVHFTPPTLPFKVRKLLAYGGAFVTDQKDLDKKTITVRIWNKDKSRQVWTGDFPWRLFFSTERWREMDIPNVRVEDDFHVEIVTHSEDMRYEGTKEIASAVAIAYTEGDEAPRSNISYAGKPLQKTEKVQRLVWCIRVEGEGPPQ